MDTEAILERLRASESLKLAALNQTINEIDSELESVNRIVQLVDSSSLEADNSLLGLIQGYPDIIRSIERIAARALPLIPSGDDPSLTEFPREMKKRIEAQSREGRYKDVLQVKDRLLWDLLQVLEIGLHWP